MTTEEIKRGPGRPPRVEEEAAIRRRRSGMGLERSLKLYYPDKLKDPKFEYRWINDLPGRIEAKTVDDDWDLVTEQRGGEEVKIKRPVDTSRNGQPLYAYLCRKPKHLYQQDKAEEQKAVTAQEEAMRRGPIPGPEGAATESNTIYVPAGRNTITRPQS